MFELYLLPVDDPRTFIAPDIAVSRSVLEWLDTALKKQPGQGFLCLTCDAEFIGSKSTSHAWLAAVAVPFAHKGPAIVSGVCPVCAQAPNQPERMLDRLRHGAFGGDLRIGPSPGNG
jgi:hypothetical protein